MEISAFCGNTHVLWILSAFHGNTHVPWILSAFRVYIRISWRLSAFRGNIHVPWILSAFNMFYLSYFTHIVKLTVAEWYRGENNSLSLDTHPPALSLMSSVSFVLRPRGQYNWQQHTPPYHTLPLTLTMHPNLPRPIPQRFPTLTPTPPSQAPTVLAPMHKYLTKTKMTR